MLRLYLIVTAATVFSQAVLERRPMSLRGFVARTLVVALALAVAPVAAADAPDATPLSGGGTVEIAFTPGDAVDNLIIAAIDRAQTEILVHAYTFTHRRDRAGADQCPAPRRNSRCSLADREQSRAVPQNVLSQLASGGVEVWLDGNFAAAHNKVIVIDAGLPRATTITAVTISPSPRNAATREYRRADDTSRVRAMRRRCRAARRYSRVAACAAKGEIVTAVIVVARGRPASMTMTLLCAAAKLPSSQTSTPPLASCDSTFLRHGTRLFAIARTADCYARAPGIDQRLRDPPVA